MVGTNFQRIIECVQKPSQPTCPNLNFADTSLFVYPSGSDPNKPWLTSTGCIELCGRVFQPYQAQDSLARFTLWLIPAIILIGHFHNPDLGFWNTSTVIIGLLGNPVGSLWAMLTRQEVY